MQFPPLQSATLIKRYKRFLADVSLYDGSEITIYCPNTGAMTGCADPGSKVWFSTSENAKRKYRHTWELVETSRGELACIHSAKANDLVKEAIKQDVVQELSGYETLNSEVKYGEENSRIDFLLERKAGPATERCYVEVKSVTLLTANGLGVFPDAVSQRGQKHLRELIAMVAQGYRAVLFFCVQHTGIDQVAPADLIDRQYGETFREALAAGVEVVAYRATITPQEIQLATPLPVLSTLP